MIQMDIPLTPFSNGNHSLIIRWPCQVFDRTSKWLEFNLTNMLLVHSVPDSYLARLIWTSKQKNKKKRFMWHHFYKPTANIFVTSRSYVEATGRILCYIHLTWVLCIRLSNGGILGHKSNRRQWTVTMWNSLNTFLVLTNKTTYFNVPDDDAVAMGVQKVLAFWVTA